MNQINLRSVQQAKKEEKDAILDIYNYAARFDTVPRIQATTVSRKERGRTRRLVEVSVALPEQKIQVVGRASDHTTAEVSAGTQFKREAEKYHAQRGSETFVIKDSGALTTENASKFLEYYKIVHPGTRLDTDSERLTARQGLRRGQITAQMKVNDELIGEPVTMRTREIAEATAALIASITLKKREPDLFPQFLRALVSGNGEILRPMAPISMDVDDDCTLIMRETILAARQVGLPDVVDDDLPRTMSVDDNRGRYRTQLDQDQIAHRSQVLQRKLSSYLTNEKLSELRKKRSELPMNQYTSKVRDLVNNSTYSIVVGATGSGKTTQVPQILLEEAVAQGKGATCNVICTQPRRIAAISVARRVAVEKAEQLQDSVGYHVRFDAKLPRVGGSINYCTTGILLQQLQHYPDEVLELNSHIVIDEVHERDMQIDFLLILLKKNLNRRKAQGKTVPKIVLMSATIDTDLFASYFQKEEAGKDASSCPTLSVPGRTFPVKERYLREIVEEIRATSPGSELQAMQLDRDTQDYLNVEDTFKAQRSGPTSTSNFEGGSNEASIIDWKRERTLSTADGTVSNANEKEDALIPFGLVGCTIAHIAKTSSEGAILVFLPGLSEIVKVQELLTQRRLGVDFGDESKYKLFLLHSSIAASQNTVFDPVPEGCRKVILATNIAETSVTIPDVQYVVDVGKLREKQYDQTRRISQLTCTWISKSNAKQRAGRAGRVQNGNYYALYSRERYNSLRAIGLPELLRADLQDICLEIKAQNFKTPIREFLAEAIEPPPAKSVDASVLNLEALDALTEDEQITPLGRLLARLPVHPSLGKMIVLGMIFRCLDPMIILGAASGERPLFMQPLDSRAEAAKAKLSFAKDSASDHIALLNATDELRRINNEHGESAMKTFAHHRFLGSNSFKTIDATAKQILEILVEAGLMPRSDSTQHGQTQYGGPSLNENSDKIPLIKAIALAGLHPNLGVSSNRRTLRTSGEKVTLIHPSSVNHVPWGRGDKDLNTDAHRNKTLYSYSTMARSNDGTAIFLKDTTESTPLMATLFGGKMKERGPILELDSWLPFYVVSPDRRTVITISKFRKALDRLLATAFKDLGDLAGNQKIEDQNGQRRFLADEKVIKIFADGLVEVLDRDAKGPKRLLQRSREPVVPYGYMKPMRGTNEDISVRHEVDRGVGSYGRERPRHTIAYEDERKKRTNWSQEEKMEGYYTSKKARGEARGKENVSHWDRLRALSGS